MSLERSFVLLMIITEKTEKIEKGQLFLKNSTPLYIYFPFFKDIFVKVRLIKTMTTKLNVNPALTVTKLINVDCYVPIVTS